MTSGGGRTQEWIRFDKPSKITKSQKQITLSYDAGRNRIRKVSTDTSTNGINKDTLYIGGLYERERITSGDNAGAETHKFYLRAGGQTIAYITQHKSKADGWVAENTRYLLSDHLGSVDTIVDENGDRIQRLSFSAWGERRKGNWKSTSPSELDGIIASLSAEAIKLNIGFTGHEHDDEVGLIYMKGRLYDAEIGRFISADPNIQAPSDIQSYNRYTYLRKKQPVVVY